MKKVLGSVIMLVVVSLLMGILPIQPVSAGVDSIVVDRALTLSEMRELAFWNRDRLVEVKGLDRDTVVRMLQEIRQAVKANAVSWKELGYSEAELKEFGRRNILLNLRWRIGWLRKAPGCEDAVANLILVEVNEAIAAGEVTWRQLECSPKELQKLKLKNQEKAAALCLKFIRQNYDLLEWEEMVGLVNKLRKAEEDGATTFEKLGTSKEEMKEWLLEKRDQLQEKYEKGKRKWQERSPKEERRQPTPVVPSDKKYELKEV